MFSAEKSRILGTKAKLPENYIYILYESIGSNNECIGSIFGTGEADKFIKRRAYKEVKDRGVGYTIIDNSETKKK